jgi:hypothetical protein
MLSADRFVAAGTPHGPEGDHESCQAVVDRGARRRRSQAWRGAAASARPGAAGRHDETNPRARQILTFQPAAGLSTNGYSRSLPTLTRKRTTWSPKRVSERPSLEVRSSAVLWGRLPGLLFHPIWHTSRCSPGPSSPEGVRDHLDQVFRGDLQKPDRRHEARSWLQAGTSSDRRPASDRG